MRVVLLALVCAVLAAGFDTAWGRLTGTPPAWHRYHEKLGWTFRPGAVWTEPSGGGVTIRIGPAGFRHDDQGGPAPSPSGLAFFGDSFTAACQVPDAERFTRLVATALGRSVANYGVTNYGPQQSLAAMRLFVPIDRPATAMFVLYLGNDLNNLLPGGARPTVRLNGATGLELEDPRLPPTWRRGLERYSAIYRWAQARGEARRRAGLDIVAEYGYLLTRPPERWQRVEEECVAIVGAMREAAGSARFLVVLLPAAWQATPGAWGAIAAGRGASGESWDPLGPARRIGTACRAAGIDTLDLAPVIHQHPRPAELFLPDGHLSPAGHELVATRLVVPLQPTHGRSADH